MGVHGRDYMRERSVFADGADDDRGPPGPPWTTRVLVGVLAVAWVVFAASFDGGRPNALGRFIADDLLLHPPTSIADGLLWQLLACAGFHSPSGIGHVGWNLVLLYVFGSAVERHRGRSRLVVTAWLGAVVWAVVPVVAERVGLRTPPLVFGATGMVLALAPAAARAFGGGVLVVVGRVVPKQGLAWVAVVGTVAIHPQIATQGGFLLSMLAAHLGALGVGWFVARVGERSPASPPPRPAQADDVVRARVDALLARIAAGGITSLSDEERAFLENASERFR